MLMRKCTVDGFPTAGRSSANKCSPACALPRIDKCELWVAPVVIIIVKVAVSRGSSPANYDGRRSGCVRVSARNDHRRFRLHLFRTRVRRLWFERPGKIIVLASGALNRPVRLFFNFTSSSNDTPCTLHSEKWPLVAWTVESLEDRVWLLDVARRCLDTLV